MAKLLGSETMAKVMQEIREHHSIKAMVLRVDSPGGSAEASDEIWNDVEHVHAEKPVVVSMSDYAASGGYYMSSAASTIVADPTTITGSIGVYGGKLNVLGLYHKLGLNVETVSRGQHAEMLSPFKDFTPDEARRFDESMQYVYDTFVQRVADGREMDEKDVERVAQGHVWSGLAASKRGLVDELGGLERAIEIAKQLANIPASEPVTIDVYPKSERNFLRRLIGGYSRTNGTTRRCSASRTSRGDRGGAATVGEASHSVALPHRHPLIDPWARCGLRRLDPIRHPVLDSARPKIYTHCRVLGSPPLRPLVVTLHPHRRGGAF